MLGSEVIERERELSVEAVLLVRRQSLTDDSLGADSTGPLPHRRVTM